MRLHLVRVIVLTAVAAFTLVPQRLALRRTLHCR